MNDHLLASVEARANEYCRTRNSHFLLEEQALTDAGRLRQAALPTLSESGLGRPPCAAAHVLGWFHYLRFTVLPAGSDLADLAQALVLFEANASTDHALPEALRPLLGAEPDAGAQAGLGERLASYGAGAGDPVALTASIKLVGRALAALPARHPDRAGHLCDLALSYLRRFELLGAPPDLRASIDCGERAAAAASTDHPAWARILTNLGAAYRTRYDHTGDGADLQTGVELAERALAATPPDHPALATRLCNLAVSYQHRFGRTRTSSDLAAAIRYGEQALASMRADHPDRRLCLSNLAVAHRDRFETGWDPEPADLAAAVEYGEQAVAATPAGDPSLGMYLSNLGASYAERFEESRAPQDMAAAVDRCERALACGPPGHPDRARRLDTLCTVYDLKYSAGLVESPAELAARLVEHATDLAAAAPMAQVFAARTAGNLLSRLGAAPDAARLLRASVRALRAAAPGELNRADQERQLGRQPGLVSEAIAAQLAVGDPGAALEVAELGRGILLAADLDRRADLAELDDVSTPAGTVVVVNVAPARSDAIVLRAGEVSSVPLPRLTQHAVREHTEELLDATGRGSWAGGLARQRVLPGLLAWLWEALAAPVLTALGHQDSPPDAGPWPRLWWVPTGAASLLPLHAAGLPGGPAVLDRVICSYTPTIRALRYSQRRRSPQARRQLTVALHQTAGLAALPGTVAEALDLHACRPDGVLLTDATATAENVLAALPQSTWAHFACHAANDPAQPSRSGLLLHDTTLAIPQIGAVRLDSAELVYLSACSTAQSRGSRADEAIHLASAFQLAGYRHVVATLWPIDDAVGALAAHHFYDLLPDSPAADAAPAALHRLARELRREHPDRPDLWSPFIHIGP